MSNLDNVARDLEAMEADTVRWGGELGQVIVLSLGDIESAANDMADDLERLADTVASEHEDALMDTDIAQVYADSISKLADVLNVLYPCENTARQHTRNALIATAHALTKELSGLREELAENREAWEQASDREATAYENQVRGDWAHDRI